MISTMSNAEYLKELRDKARREGKCGVCRARPAKPDRATCQHCLDLATAKKNANRYKRCRYCNQPWTKTLACPECSSKHVDRQFKKRIARVTQDLCSTCGERPRAKNRRQCRECCEEGRLIARARNRIDGRTPQIVRCTTCDSTEHNARYHERGEPIANDRPTQGTDSCDQPVQSRRR